MYSSPKLTATKKTALMIVLISLMAPCTLGIQLVEAASKMITYDVGMVDVQLPESASPSPTPTPSPKPTFPPTDLKPLPTTLLVAVAILACVFGFGLIVNLVAGKKKRKTSRVRLV